MNMIPENIKQKIEEKIKELPDWDYRDAIQFGYQLALTSSPAQEREVYRWVKAKVIEVIETVKAQYPTSIFPENGTSPDAKAAIMARLTCDNIKRETEIMFNDDEWLEKIPLQSSPLQQLIDWYKSETDKLKEYQDWLSGKQVIDKAIELLNHNTT